MKVGTIFFVVIGLFLTSCATQKQWSASGGSRADGIVELSYEFGLFEMPRVNEEQGLALAKSRCRAWGYSGVETFGGSSKECSNFSTSGCSSWKVTSQYQCTGSLEK